MKKKNMILLSIVCVLTLIFLCGLLVAAFKIQENRDRENDINGQNAVVTPEGGDDGSDQSGDITGTPGISPSAAPSSDGEMPSDGGTASGGASSSDNGTTDAEGASQGENSSQGSASQGTVNPGEADSAVNQGGMGVGSSDTPGAFSGYPIVLGFAGDVNFNEGSKPDAKYDSEGKGILGGLSADLVDEMKSANIMMLNNEFAYSKRGAALPNKSYTFRADPKRVDILHEMGADIVSLANNHALDYGQDALLDTFTTLEDAGIDYVGAGINMDRAKAPVYYTIGDTKIAYLAASRVIYALDWYATDTRPGMIGTYDSALFVKSIQEAAKNSDFVVAFVHWGVEQNNYPEDYQRTLAHKYIDAGADVVIGCHPHVVQGMEFYKGKPIAYSLGNFWFNAAKVYSGLIKVSIDSDGTMKTQLLPVMANNTYTYILEKESERKAYYDFMEEISSGVSFDEDGFVTEKP